MFAVSVAVLLLIMHWMHVCTSEWKCGGCLVCLMCTNVWWADQQQHTIYPAIHPHQLPPAAAIPESLLWTSKGHIPSSHPPYQLSPAAAIPESLLWTSKGHLPIQPSTLPAISSSSHTREPFVDFQRTLTHPAIHLYQLSPPAAIPENLLWPSKGHIPMGFVLNKKLGQFKGWLPMIWHVLFQQRTFLPEMCC